MNIIAIDYTVITDEELKLICNKYLLNYKQMISDRKTYKLKKVFIDISNTKLIAFTTKRKPLDVQFSNGASDVFLSLPNCKIVEEQTKAPAVDLNVDDILDKITKFGINSLLQEERDFLDNSSK